MKKAIYILCSLCILFGCSLKEEVMSNSTRKTYYKNEMQVRTSLNGCYTNARSILCNSAFWQMTECTTDLISMSLSNQYNANCDVSPSRPGVSATVWSNGYTGVMRCNEIIDVLTESEYFTDEQKLPWIAEAMVMRALYYYLLTSTFGDVPFYTEAVTERNRAKIASLPRMSADDTRDYLIDQMMEYLLPESEGGKEALPLQRTYENPDKAYVGAAVGLMVAGKFCMWNKRYEDAIKVFGQLEKIYGDYSGTNKDSFKIDYPLRDVRWDKKNVKESILEVGNYVEEYGLQIRGAIARYCMPVRSTFTKDGIEEKAVYDGVVIPELGEYANTQTGAMPTSYFYNRVQPYYSEDERNGKYSNNRTSEKAADGSGNLAWRWVGTGYVNTNSKTKEKNLIKKSGVYWFNEPSNDTPAGGSSKPYGNRQPWLGEKFWCFGMYNTQDGNNYKIFRYAGVLLNLAEAYLMLDDPDKACAYLNITRYRAAENVDTFKPITYASVGSNKETLMEEIRMECARELFGEFQRKFDLVRWGIWYERACMYNEGKYIKGYILPCHEYWPIPAEQVTYSGNALDNEAYKGVL